MSIVLQVWQPASTNDSLRESRHEAIAKALFDAGYNVVQTPQGKIIVPAVAELQVGA